MEKIGNRGNRGKSRGKGGREVWDGSGVGKAIGEGERNNGM